MTTAREVGELLDERPDLKPAVEAVLEPDPPFTFHDVAVDSGRFGELVSAGILEKTDDEYRVSDPSAVERALAGQVTAKGDVAGSTIPTVTLSIDGLEAGLLTGALGMVVLFRLVPLSTVYREGVVVLSSNDPYYYRYWVEGLVSAPDITLLTLPGGITKGEPLLVTTLWLLSEVFGGTSSVVGHVLAWYPVVSAVLSAVLVYIAVRLMTDDRRIALAAIALLAVLPAHALRTSLGFADHHAFDYLWLALTVAGLVLAAHTAHRGRSGWQSNIVAAFIIGLGVAGQTLAWDNSPILLAPLGVYLAVDGIRSVYIDESPLSSGGPVLVGTALGAVAVWSVHSTLGWHTPLVATAPFLVAIGGMGVLALGELVHRAKLPVWALIAADSVGGTAGIVVLSVAFPDYWARLTTSLSTRLLAPRPIAEVQGLFSDSGGWLLLYGFILFLAIPYLVWGTYHAIDDIRWLPASVYAWYFLLLAIIQVRFVGEHALVIVSFAGLGLVHLAERIELARRPAPFADGAATELSLPGIRALGQLTMLFLLVAGLSIAQVPVKTSQVTTPPELYDTAAWLEEYSEDRDLEYPGNYVFSSWSRNRVFNYFVNGESSSYRYAQQHFQSFVRSTDPDGWFDRLSDRGFVVTTPEAVGERNEIGTRLHEHNGVGTASTTGLAHFRLVYVSENSRYKAFAIVPGAVIRGTAAPNATVNAETDVVVQDERYTYRRQVAAAEDGNFSIRVAHPGTYRVAGMAVTVREADVEQGATVTVEEAGP